MLLSISLRKITVVTKKPTVETKLGCDFFLFWMLDVSQTASYEITLVRQSVCVSACPPVCPSLSFLKIGSLVFSDIVHDYS